MKVIGTVLQTNDGRDWVWFADDGQLFEVVETDRCTEMVEHDPIEDDKWSWTDANDYLKAIGN